MKAKSGGGGQIAVTTSPTRERIAKALAEAAKEREAAEHEAAVKALAEVDDAAQGAKS